MITIPNGWRGILSPDGSMVASGNGIARIHSAINGQLVSDLGGVDGGGSGALYPCGWNGGTLCVSEQLLAGRRLLHSRLSIDPAQLPGYRPTVAVVNGHTCSSVNGQHFIDGNLMTYADSSSPCWDIEDFDGQHYLYKETDSDPWPVVVRKIDGTVALKYDFCWYQNSRVFTAPDGRPWVFANLNGRSYVVGPEHLELPPGESRGVITWRNGSIVVWSVVIDRNGEPVIIGRDVADGENVDAPAYQLRGLWFAGLDCVVTADGYRFAGYYDGPGGTLYVDTIPFDAPRAPFRWKEEAPAPVPVPEPEPITPPVIPPPAVPPVVTPEPPKPEPPKAAPPKPKPSKTDILAKVLIGLFSLWKGRR